MRRSSRLWVLAAGLVAAAAAAAPASALTFLEYGTTYRGGAITLGPNGNLWFAENDDQQLNGRVGEVTPGGTVTEFTVPAGVAGMAAGSDGALWFTVPGGIGRITTTGTSVGEVPLPSADSEPQDITAGPDGNLWFTEWAGDAVGRITTSGTITEFPLPHAGSFPNRIAAGPDGNLWFTEFVGNRIGRITPSGTITEFALPTASSDPGGIAAGPDGNLWFTEANANAIGRVTPGGTITEFAIPTANAAPQGIAAGWDGNLWFTELGSNRVGRITTGGSITDFAVPVAGSEPYGIAAGPTGTMWFTQPGASKVGTFVASTVHIRYIAYVPAFFDPTIGQLSDLGAPATWLMLNPGVHGVADATGLHLFGYGVTGGPQATAIGSTFTFAFDWAGAYAYDDPFDVAVGGQVKVPTRVSLEPGTTGTARVVWATADAPAGDVFDVQVKVPGASSYVSWRRGQAALLGDFGPSDPLWAGPGTYGFRARLRGAGGGSGSTGWSPARAIALS